MKGASEMNEKLKAEVEAFDARLCSTALKHSYDVSHDRRILKELVESDNRLTTALQSILDEGAAYCEGWETTIVKIAREALGITKEGYWGTHSENLGDQQQFNELTDKHGYDKGVLIYHGLPVDEVLAYSDEDAEAAIEAMSSFT